MKKHQKTNIVLTVLAVAVLVAFYPLVRDLMDFATLESFLAQFGMLAPLIYGFLYVILGLLFFPVSLYAIFAGMLFGKLTGFLVVSVFSTITGMVGFFLSHRLSPLVPKAQKGLIRSIQKSVEHKMKNSTFEVVSILRLLFINFTCVTYAVGLIRTSKFWQFALATFFANLPYLFIFAYFGSELDRGWRAALVPAVLVGAILIVAIIIEQNFRRRFSAQK